jgi:hypothetical protein
MSKDERGWSIGQLSDLERLSGQTSRRHRLVLRCTCLFYWQPEPPFLLYLPFLLSLLWCLPLLRQSL